MQKCHIRKLENSRITAQILGTHRRPMMGNYSKFYRSVYLLAQKVYFYISEKFNFLLNILKIYFIGVSILIKDKNGRIKFQMTSQGQKQHHLYFEMKSPEMKVWGEQISVYLLKGGEGEFTLGSVKENSNYCWP